MDTVGDDTDDSLFEYTFNPATNVVTDNDATGTTLTNCGSGAQNCFDYVMREEFDPTMVSDCSGLNASSSGIIYVTGPCTSLPSVIGSVTDPAIVVIDGSDGIAARRPDAVLRHVVPHSDSQGASLKGSGNATHVGAVVVEGNVDFSGNLTIVYDDTSVSSDPHKLPASAKFGRVPGSWLDSQNGILR